MFVGFLQQIIEIVRSLLPNSNDNNKTWVIKVLLAGILVSWFGYATYFVMVTTTLGESYNIKLNTKIPSLTHMELVITRRQVWQQLSRLRIEDENIRAIFQLMLIDKKTRNVVLTDTLDSNRTDLVIWDFEFPVQRYSAALEVVEDITNNLQTEVEAKIRKEKQCLTLPLGGKPLAALKRAIPGFAATHASLCPLYTFYNPRLIGGVLIFFKIQPPLEPWYYEEKLRLATNQISAYFRDFTIHYEIIYE